MVAADRGVDRRRWRQVSQAHFSRVAPDYDAGRLFAKGEFWATEIAERLSLSEGGWLLDLGCGTGRCALAFARRFPSRVVGLDLSEAMLRQALAKTGGGAGVIPRTSWGLGEGERLPFASRTFRVVFMSQVWHHLEHERQAAAEFFRVLQPGGYLLVNTFSHAQIRARWDMSLFPDLLPFMFSIYPDLPELTATLRRAGFAAVTHQVYERQVRRRPSTLLEVAEKGLWSMFAHLDRVGRQAGMARLKRLVVETDDAPVASQAGQILVTAVKSGEG